MHLDGKLLVGALLGGQVSGAKGALAQDGPGLVVLPAVGVAIGRQDPVACGGLGTRGGLGSAGL